MTPSPLRPRLARLLPMALALLVAVVAPSAALAAPSPEVRDCIERNLPRYTNPGSAVVAQYADAETLCQAFVEGGASVQFDPGPGDDDADPVAGSSGQGTTDGGTPSDSPGPGGGATTSPGRTATPAAPAAGAPAGTPAPTAATLVRGTIATADAGAGSPLPSSVSDGPIWLIVLLAGAGVAIVGAGVVAARRRAR